MGRPKQAPRTSGKIAFCRWLPGQGRQVFTMHTTGTRVTQVTGGKGQGQNWRPAWSPDGQRICFVSDRDGWQRLYTMKADGSEQERLTALRDAHDDCPDWSPLGDRIAFSRGNGESLEDLHVLELQCGAELQLTSGDTLDSIPSWSPDGKLIVFRRTLGDPAGICVIRAHGGQPQYVADGYGPAWSPLGDRIACSQGGDIWLLPVDRAGQLVGEPVRLTSDPETHDRHPSWSPDGAQIAFQSELWEQNRCVWHILTVRADGTEVHDLGEGEQPAWQFRGHNTYFAQQEPCRDRRASSGEISIVSPELRGGDAGIEDR